MREPEALTASLLGSVGAESIIGPTLRGALGKKRRVDDLGADRCASCGAVRQIPA